MSPSSAYIQLLGMGAVFIAVHCVGMCGPIVLGLDVGGARALTRGRGATRVVYAVLRVGAYQFGKALTYSALGALAGGIGQGLDEVAASGGAYVSIALALIISISAFKTRPRSDTISIGRPRRRWRISDTVAKSLDFLRLKLVLFTAGPELLPRVLLGALLAFLPCMITIWALALAASTRSVLHGAGVMMLLAIMTSPMLVLVASASHLIPRIPPRLAPVVQRAALLISSAIILLASLAELGVIAHQHSPFEFQGERYMIMFW